MYFVNLLNSLTAEVLVCHLLSINNDPSPEGVGFNISVGLDSSISSRYVSGDPPPPQQVSKIFLELLI